MQKVLKRMLLAALLFLPIVTNAQQTLTVADGTTTNSYVPIYGYYADAYLRSQFIYPADSLSTMAGQTILSMTFYSDDASFSGLTMAVSVGIQADTCKFTSSAFDDTTVMTTVYTGTVDIVNGVLEIEFDSPFNYNGGHFIVDFQSITVSSNYPSTNFYGTTSAWSSISGNDYSGVSYITPTRRNFLPKVTFAYGTAPTCLRPNNMQFSDVASDQITVSWTSNGTPQSYILEYAESAFSAGQGSAIAVADTFYTLTNLNPATQYFFLVRGVCGSTEGDTSFALSGDCYTTCVPVAALPLVMTFDSIDDAPLASTSLPACWSRNNDATYYYYETNPMVYDALYDGNNEAYFELYDYYVSHADLVFPQMDTNSILMDNIMVRFDALSEYAPYVILGVYTDPDNASTFTPTDTVQLVDGDDFLAYELTTMGYAGNGSYLALRVILNGNDYSAAALIDNINVIPIPDCKTPAYLNGVASMTDIELTWTPRGEESAWLVSLNGTEFVNVTDASYTITGLAADSCVSVTVAALCDGGDTSNTVSGTFCTLNRIPVSEYPYFCDFDVDTMAAQWTLFNEDQTNHWVVDSINGSKALYITNSSASPYVNAYDNSSSSTVYAANLFYLEAGDYLVSFKWNCYGESTYDYLRALLTPSSTAHVAGYQVYTYSSTPNNCIALDSEGGNFKLNLSSGWTTRNAVVHINNSNNYQMVFMWRNDGSVGTNPPAAIDSISIMRLACSQPSNLTYSATTDSLVFSWTSTSSEFVVNIDGSESVVYDTFFVAENLLAGTDYSFSVTSICGGDTSVATTITASTQCGMLTQFPYVQNFNSVYVDPNNYYDSPLPNCWTRNSSSASNSNDYPCVVTSGGVDNSQALVIYTYSGSYYYYNVSLPAVDTTVMPIRNLVLGFMAKVSYSGDSQDLIIGVSVNPADTSTFTPVDTVNVNTTNFTEFNVPLLNYSDTGLYVTIRATDNYYVETFIDDLVLYRYSTCARPDSLQAVTYSDSIALSWVPGGQESQWRLTYNNTEVLVNTPHYTVTGLTPDTYYTFDLVALCDDGDSSLMRSLTVHTTCTPVSELPYFYGFEDAVGTDPYSTTSINSCWNRISYSSSYSYPYPYSEAASGSRSLCFYGYNSSAWSYAVMPMFELPVDSLQVSFKVRQMYESSYYFATLEVGVMDNPFDINTFVPVRSVNATSVVSWDSYHVYFNGYTGTGRYIAFRTLGDPNSYDYNYVLLDDVTVDYAPTCYPSDGFIVLSSGADNTIVCWNGNGVPDFEVTYTDGTTSNTVYTTTDTLTLNGLSVATPYTVYIRAICSVGDTADALVGSFSTLNALNATVPYVCDFGAPEGAAWNYAQANQANIWTVGTAAYNGTTNNNGLYVSSDNGVTNSYDAYSASTSFAYRNITLAADDYVFSYDWNCEGEGTSYAYDYMRVAIFPASHPILAGSTSWTYQTTPSDAVVLDNGSFMNFSGGWSTFSGEFSIADSGDYNIVFMWRNDGSVGSQPPAAVDNIVITVNTCPMVSNLVDAGVGSTFASVDWVEAGTATQWQVEYTTADTTISFVTNSHPVTINNLDTLSNVSVRVRPVCGDGDTGMYCAPVMLSTSLCDNPTFASIANDSSEYTNYNYYYPFYYCGYITLTQTILDTTILGAEPADFEAISFNYIGTSQMPTHPNVQMYLQPTTKSQFVSSSDFESLSPSAIKVYDGSMDAVYGWNTYRFDTILSYDGTTNYNLIIINNSYNYQYGDFYFRGVQSDIQRSIMTYMYDNTPIDPLYPSGDYSYATTYSPDLRLVSCAAVCPVPAASAAVNNYQSATITWTSAADTVEYAIKTAAEPAYPVEMRVANNGAYAAVNLMPATTYQFRVRAICEEGLVSDWAEVSFTTDSLPCFDPSELAVQATGYTTATLGWTANGEESNWRIHVWNTSFEQTYDVTSNPATVTGLVSDVEYSAEVMAVCGGVLESGVSNTVTFRTARCEAPTNVSGSNITAHTAVVSWNGDASSYRVEYGTEGFGTGEGTSVTATGTTVTLTDLLDDQTYDVYVYAVCAEGLESAASQKHTFETTTEGIDIAGGMNVSIYPNPTTSATTVALSGVNGEVTITVVDMNGRVVKSETVSCDGDCTKRMDVEGLAQGAYFVRVSGENLNMVKKLVVK